jgi:hypothetical protein
MEQVAVTRLDIDKIKACHLSANRCLDVTLAYQFQLFIAQQLIC